MSPAPAKLPPLVDMAEVCRRLHLSRTGVNNLADSGELIRLKIGGAVRFDPADIEAFIERVRTAEKGRVAERAARKAKDPQARPEGAVSRKRPRPTGASVPAPAR